MRVPSSSTRRGSRNSTRRQKADCQDTVLRWRADEGGDSGLSGDTHGMSYAKKKSQHVVVAYRRSKICLHEDSA